MLQDRWKRLHEYVARESKLSSQAELEIRNPVEDRIIPTSLTGQHLVLSPNASSMEEN